MTQLKQVWAGKNDAKQINPDLRDGVSFTRTAVLNTAILKANIAKDLAMSWNV